MHRGHPVGEPHQYLDDADDQASGLAVEWLRHQMADEQKVVPELVFFPVDIVDLDRNDY